MGRERRSSSGEQSAQSVEPDSRKVTRSRSRAAGSVTSPQSAMAPTVTQEEASGSPSTASKRLRLSSAPRRGRRGITGEVTADGGAQVVTSALTATPASTVGVEEVEVVPRSVAPAASDSMEATAFVPNSPIRRPDLVEYDSNGQQLSEPSIWPDPELSKAYEKARQQYFEKIGSYFSPPIPLFTVHRKMLEH